MAITYADITMYLEGIANAANNDPGQAIHHYWWHQNHDQTQPLLDYNDFINGTVFSINVPIINKADPLNTAFYLVLAGGDSKYGPQMPQGGPYLTDGVTTWPLSNGTAPTGATILANIEEWLSNGYPE
jgi:hypothetical protein